MKEELALDHVAYFHGINNIPHFPRLRELDHQRLWFGPPKQKKDRPYQLVPLFKKILAVIPMDFGLLTYPGTPLSRVPRKGKKNLAMT
jgi:hypothetical protein